MPTKPPRSSLHTKLSPPSVSATQVPRQRLADLMFAERSTRLVLVRAPAGFGKTTAMLQYRSRLEQLNVQTAWLTLDHADNDAARFLYCLGAALADIVSDVPDDEPGEDATFHLVSRLARCQGSFTLFIDEFEVVREPGVLGLVREVVHNLPRGGQVVIGTRSLPDLGLGRLRARGHLVEIDAEQLRFSVDETVEFLSGRRGIALASVDVLRLHEKTEGWIAGLWLASVSLARHEAKADFIARFSGSNLGVAAYLTEDVLNLQVPEVRSFLLRTSILRHLTPELCRTLCPEIDAEALLRRLDAESVLITPIEGEEAGYRYHSLFAGFLKAQLVREAPQEVPRLHRVAAGWYEAQQRPVPAIDHALEGGDLAHAVGLLETHAVALLSAGRMRLLSRWLDAVPERALTDHPHLGVIHLWAVCFTRGPWEAMARLERSGLAASTLPGVRSHLTALRPTLLAMMDRPDEAYAVGRECVANLPTGERFADHALLTTMAAVCCVNDLSDEALRLLDVRRRVMGSDPAALTEMHSETIEGMIALYEGRMREAGARFRIAVAATGVADRQFTNGNAWAGILYACAVYETDDLEQATNLLRIYIPLARDVGLADHVTLGYRMLCRIAFRAGDVDQALRMLAELEALGQQRQLPRVAASAMLERSRILLLQGRLQAAGDELARACDESIWAPIAHRRLLSNDIDYPGLARLRWEAQVGDATATLDTFEREIDAALAARRRRRAIALRVLRAVALHRDGHRARALASLEEVLKECCSEGFFRIVLDEGPAVGVLVRELLANAPTGTGAARDPIFSAWVQRLLSSWGSTLPDLELAGEAATPFEDGEEARAGVVTSLADPPSRKEIRILELLAEGYSNAAMAEKLCVSDSTVRTHLRNINGKLGVRSRMQAVAVARKIGLLG